MVIALRDDEAYWLDQLTVVSGPASARAYAASDTVRGPAGFTLD